MPDTTTAVHPFNAGEKYRVIKPGAKLTGWQPVGRGALQGWESPLAVGAVLTCAGTSMTQGDGVPVVKWTDRDGGWIANDCEFAPSVGGMWSSRPDSSYLEVVHA